MRTPSSARLRQLTLLSIFTALVFILQMLGSFIHLGPFSISLVLLPIVLGAALCGPFAGAWLGLVFGLAVLASGDAAAFLAVDITGTVLTVLAKGLFAGLISGLVFYAIQRKSEILAVFTAALVCPLINTGIFLLGCLAFFMDTIAEWAAALGFGGDVGGYMIFGLVGANFLAELAINILLAPIILRLIRLYSRA